MVKLKTKFITRAAVIAALYAAIAIVQPWSSGEIQIRVSESMTVLAGLVPAAIPGIFAGCLITNIFVGAGVLDIIFGSLASLIAAALSYKLRRNKWLVPLPPVVVNAVIVGSTLHYTINSGVPLWLNMVYVGAGQIVACYILGLPFLYALSRIIAKRAL